MYLPTFNCIIVFFHHQATFIFHTSFSTLLIALNYQLSFSIWCWNTFFWNDMWTIWTDWQQCPSVIDQSFPMYLDIIQQICLLQTRMKKINRPLLPFIYLFPPSWLLSIMNHLLSIFITRPLLSFSPPSPPYWLPSTDISSLFSQAQYRSPAGRRWHHICPKCFCICYKQLPYLLRRNIDF